MTQLRENACVVANNIQRASTAQRVESAVRKAVKDSSDAWSITLRIQDTDMEFKIDTGADISVMSEQTYKALNTRPNLMFVNAALDCPGGKLISSGRFETSTHHKGNKYCFTVFVITGQSVNNLLSR